MSTLGVRRLKERGGGGGGRVSAAPVKQSKPITPVSDTAKVLLTSTKRSAEAEKPRSVSRGPAWSSSQKPMIRQMPRIDRSSAVGATATDDGEARRRLASTSSVPRGRSSSPSDFSRVLSDLRSARVSSRVSADATGRVNANDNRRAFVSVPAVKGGKWNGLKVSDNKGSKEANFKGSEKRSHGDRKENVNEGSRYGKISVKFDSEGMMTRENQSDTKSNVKDRDADSSVGLHNRASNGNLSTIQSKHDVGDIPARSECKSGLRDDGVPTSLHESVVTEQCNEALDAAHMPNLGSEIERTVSDSSLKVRVGKHLSKEEDSGGSSSGRFGNKYPSKLHEKLAFLEGKVKRIASDIKRTKDMLDTNNPDASKVILSDIQQKILGIEKAMSNVMGEPNGNLTLPRSTNDGLLKHKEINPTLPLTVSLGNVSVKGLSCEEIESRLFSHHKLLKGSVTGNVSSFRPKTYKAAPVSELVKGPGSDYVSPAEENLIALEFLTSLGKENPKGNELGMNNVKARQDVQETEDNAKSGVQKTSTLVAMKTNVDLELAADEKLEDFDEQENTPMFEVEEEDEEDNIHQLREIGRKNASGGWFVSEGESVILAHDDGSCSFYDIANSEEKAEYRPPSIIPQCTWRDCWIVRAPTVDGCSGKYVVAASAGNTLESGFCSWDFYTKQVEAFHLEDKKSTNTRSVLGPLDDNVAAAGRRNSSCTAISAENKQWWYKPCGTLIASTATDQRMVQIYDIRDGEKIMKWNVTKPVSSMDYSSPLQWRNRGKLVVAEVDAVSLWDVSSLTPEALMSVSTSSRKISALHVCNTESEMGGGVRQRVTSAEAEGHDGVFCTPDSINILDFRHPSGVGLKIQKAGLAASSVYSRGDSVFVGSSSVKSAGKKQNTSQVQQFSLRRQKLVSTYVLPESNSHTHHSALTQVWGTSSLVMGVCGQGLHVYDALEDEGLPPYAVDYGTTQKVKEVIGPDDLYCPSFDYSSSQVLVISRDRPAMFKYL